MATAFVNKHITRVLAAGGTIVDPTWLATVDAWITSQGLLPYLFDWSNPALGVVKNGSNQISKIMGLGTTWLPRLGDLTPSDSTKTLYDATAIGGLPGWTNSVDTAYSYYGLARAGTIRTQHIRRKHHQGVTLVAVFKKSHAFVSSPFGMGQFGGLYLQNTAGSPGSCKFLVGPTATSVSDTNSATLANGSVHIIGGTFDQDTAIAYVEGVGGAGQSGYIAANTDANKNQYRPLLGAANLVNQIYYQVVSGSDQSHVVLGSGTAITFNGTDNQADMSVSDLIVFYTALTPTQMASLNALLRSRYGP
jgi:hypothetical protein